MIIVGLTGGIGSGKTTVAKMFKALGIPIYIADEEAKKLMNISKVIKRKLITLFGDEAYTQKGLNRPYLAQIIFNDKTALEKINAIVHPRIAKHFKKWVLRQKAPYIIKEVAILFEHGGYKTCDYIITVTAPKSQRISRVLDRDDTTTTRIESIMKNQWEDEKRLELSDFVIENINLKKTKLLVHEIHQQILKKIS